MSHPQFSRFRTALAVLAVVASLPAIAAAQPVPTSTFVNVPTAPFVGENVTFTLQFDNTHASLPGYGPYIDLILPATGADGAGAATDDGITFLNATYLGVPVTAQTFTFPWAARFRHPYARNASNQPITVTGTPGHQLVVLQLPFGSFTWDQPPADIVVNVAMSNLADVGTALTMQTRGGFRVWRGPAGQRPVRSVDLPRLVHDRERDAAALRLRKTYLGPEDETATGPNFPGNAASTSMSRPGRSSRASRSATCFRTTCSSCRLTRR